MEVLSNSSHLNCHTYIFRICGITLDDKSLKVACVVQNSCVASNSRIYVHNICVWELSSVD